MSRSALVALVAALALLAAGAGTSAAAVDCIVAKKPKAKPDGGQKPPTSKERLDPRKTYRIVFTTNCGSFTVTLDVKGAPRTSASLVKLARHGFFDRTVFHRIIPDFVVQGGDPTATGSGGPGYSTVDRPRADARYALGTVAMAKTGAEAPGTSGSQFFIVTAKLVPLPPDYAIVGRVTAGQKVVDKIGLLGSPTQEGTPKAVVEILKARVTVS